MIIEIVPQFSNLALIVFKLAVIILLQLQIFSFHIRINALGKIRCRQTNTADIGNDAGNQTWPHHIGRLRCKKVQLNTATNEAKQITLTVIHAFAVRI